MEARDIHDREQLDQAAGEQDFLSVAQVAKQLGVTVSLVQKWRRLGWLPATQLGPPDVPVYGYRPVDVEHFVRERWNRRRGRPPGSDDGPKSEVASPKSEVQEPALSLPTSPKSEVRTVASGAERDKPARRPRAQAAAVPQVPLPPLAEREAPAPSPAAEMPLAPLPAPVPDAPPAPDASTSERQAAGPRTSELEPRASNWSDGPLVLWDGDPNSGKALVLGRFPAGQIERALRTAAAYARRYDALVLGEAPMPGAQPRVVAAWRNGQRVTSE